MLTRPVQDLTTPTQKRSAGMVTSNRVFEQIKNPLGEMEYVFLSEAVPKRHVSKAGYVSTGHAEYYPEKKIAWKLCTDHETENSYYLDNIYNNFDRTKLWQDIRLFIYDYIDLPDDKLYDVMTSWILCTWIWESIPVVPYLFFYGAKNSGKTRGLEILKELCYRGILGSTISTAAVYRTIEKHHPTLLLDETDSWGEEKLQELIGILNSGYRKGTYAIRCATGKNTDNEVRYFDVFGFKAIAGTEQLKDTLESRCIIFNMMTNKRNIELFIDQERAAALRTRLLFWRLIHFQKGDGVTFGDASPGGIGVLHKEEVPNILKETKNGRLIELFLFLYKYADDLGRKEILEYAIEEGKKQSLLDETSYEAEVLQIIVDLSLEQQSRFISTSSITSRFNAIREKNDWWRSTTIGKIVRRLGFPLKRTKRSRGIEIEKNRLLRLCKRYNIDYKLSINTPVETSLNVTRHPLDELLK